MKLLKNPFVLFGLSTLITWLFIDFSPVYTNLGQKLLSCSIAGAKWTIQLGAAYYFLGEKKWEYFEKIGWVCFLGSLLLLPYTVLSLIGKEQPTAYFFGSLVTSVAFMVFLYFIQIKRLNIGAHWWALWMICLSLAITAQLKIVFNVTLF